MPLKFASWAHGNAMDIAPGSSHLITRPSADIQRQTRSATEQVFAGSPGIGVLCGWIPTPVIVDGERLHLDSVILRFRTDGASLWWIKVGDGETEILTKDFSRHTFPSADWTMQRFSLDPAHEVKWGIGIAIGVHFGYASTPTSPKFAGASPNPAAASKHPPPGTFALSAFGGDFLGTPAASTAQIDAVNRRIDSLAEQIAHAFEAVSGG